MNNLNAVPNKNRHIAVTVASALAVALFGAFLFERVAGSRPAPGASSRPSYFQQTEQKGILSAADYARLAQVSDSILHRHKMSDDDLSAWAAVLQKGPLRDTPSNRMAFDSLVLGLGVGRKRLTPAQQGKMYDAVLPFVSDAAYVKAMNPSDKTDAADPTSPQCLRAGAEGIAVLLAETRDPRALGVLDDLARNSADPRLRRAALKSHDALAAALMPTGGKQ